MNYEGGVMNLIRWMVVGLILSSPGLAADYNRSDWRHWVDLDSDCQDARAEALIASSSVPVTIVNCRVVSGRWVGPYTGQVFTQARGMDIDHVVPLAEAHDSGAQQWSPEQRRAFANDPENLLPTSASANRSKGRRDPAQWLPPLTGYHCAYLTRWQLIKVKYGLTMDAAERLALKKGLVDC